MGGSRGALRPLGRFVSGAMMVPWVGIGDLLLAVALALAETCYFDAGTLAACISGRAAVPVAAAATLLLPAPLPIQAVLINKGVVRGQPVKL